MMAGPWIVSPARRSGRHHTPVSTYPSAASKQTGVPVGYPCGTREQAARRVADGFRFINYGSDSAILTAGLLELLEHRREW